MRHVDGGVSDIDPHAVVARADRLERLGRADAGARQQRQEFGIGLEVLAHAPQHEALRGLGDEGREGVSASAEGGVVDVDAELAQARNGIAVGRAGGRVEDLDEALLHVQGDDVLPAAGLVVDLLPLEADDLGQEALGEAVRAHDLTGQLRADPGQFDGAVLVDEEEFVAFHARDGLGDGRAGLVEPLGDPRAQRRHALLEKLVDRAEVHLRGVDQVAQGGHLLPGPSYPRRRAGIRRFSRGGCEMVTSGGLR